MYRKILCPVDDSQPARHGLREAVKLAAEMDATLLVLHVIDSTGFLFYPPDIPDLGNYLQSHGEKILHNALTFAQKGAKHVESRLVEIREGRVAAEIIACAKQSGADLIVMGTIGRRGLASVVLGSDAAMVVSLSTIPVLLVK